MSISKWLYLYLIIISTGCAQREIWLPDSSLTPEEAVEIQLKAFLDNPFPASDFGIKTAWEFASPANKTITGPFDRFQEMLLSERYYPLLTTQAYSVEEHFQEKAYAQYFAVIKTKDDQRVHYVFDLSFQTDNDCWMVDAVLLMPERFQQNPNSVAMIEGFRSAPF
ncbi:MAG: hypothetical protein RIF33_19500 [Cyclobacteriaceae bacterium]